jgi:hypothetical protein
MRLTEDGVVVQGMSGAVRSERETVLRDALLEAARRIERGAGPSEWAPYGETCITLSEGRSLHVDAGPGRGFGARLVGHGRTITLTCPIVDGYDDLTDPAARTVAHLRWSDRVLSSPRTRDRHPAWTRVATDIAALAAAFHEGSSGACTLQPGPSTDPIKVESTGRAGWRLDHTQAVVDHVARHCPPYVQVVHGRRTGRDGSTCESVVVDHGPKVMCFAASPDPIERMRLMISTGLDPADLFRVEDDHG